MCIHWIPWTSSHVFKRLNTLHCMSNYEIFTYDFIDYDGFVILSSKLIAKNSPHKWTLNYSFLLANCGWILVLVWLIFESSLTKVENKIFEIIIIIPIDRNTRMIWRSRLCDAYARCEHFVKIISPGLVFRKYYFFGL